MQLCGSANISRSIAHVFTDYMNIHVLVHICKHIYVNIGFTKLATVTLFCDDLLKNTSSNIFTYIQVIVPFFFPFNYMDRYCGKATHMQAVRIPRHWEHRARRHFIDWNGLGRLYLAAMCGTSQEMVFTQFIHVPQDYIIGIRAVLRYWFMHTIVLISLVWTHRTPIQSNECFTSCSPFYQHGLTLIPAWICNHIYHKVWDEITYPFLNFNGATVEV